jgi:hypothetical protein
MKDEKDWTELKNRMLKFAEECEQKAQQLRELAKAIDNFKTTGGTIEALIELEKKTLEAL